MGDHPSHVPYLRTLNANDLTELAGAIQILLAEKEFEGCGGLEMTDEIRVTIAAQAAVLLLHRETDFYPRLRTILVYPHGYTAAGHRADSAGIVAEGPQQRLGEIADVLPVRAKMNSSSSARNLGAICVSY